MKPTSDILYLLLQEFNSEKFNRFISFAKIFHTENTLKQIIKIAVGLKKQQVFNEAPLKKHIGNHYKELKSKTYYCLLDFLRIEHKDKSFIDVNRLIDFALLMQDKSHWKEAARFYEKATGLATVNRSDIYNLLIIAHKGWSIYKTDKENAPLRAVTLAKENSNLSEKYYQASKIYFSYAFVAEIILRTYLLRNLNDITAIQKTLIELNSLNNISKGIESQNILMTKEWCLQLLGNHKEAFDIEQKVFNDYYNNYSQNKTSFKALITSAFMNYVSVCASAKNKDAYICALNQFHNCFNIDFEVNPLLHLVYLTFNIQKATCFNEVSNLTYDLLQLETVYNNIPKGSIDIAIAKSCESALYHCHNILGNYDKAKHYCENVMKLKLTTGFRKDYIEIANLYYMVILFEEALQKQSSKNILKFEDQLLKIHANQYYERIRKSTDNYSFDLLFINFFRKLPEKIKKHDLKALFEIINANTQDLKSKPENLYIYNMMILLDFEKWLTDKIEHFS